MFVGVDIMRILLLVVNFEVALASLFCNENDLVREFLRSMLMMKRLN